MDRPAGGTYSIALPDLVAHVLEEEIARENRGTKGKDERLGRSRKGEGRAGSPTPLSLETCLRLCLTESVDLYAYVRSLFSFFTRVAQCFFSV